tara:strand:+ start:5411 stop:6325 length:915 start_codon:yes stop_codon:yes gene_type:complete
MAFKTSVTYVTITGKAAYQLARGEVSYSDVTATEIKLDAYSINQRPIDQFSFADLAAIGTQKNTLDSLGFTDVQAVAMAKGVVDSVGFSEDFTVLLIIERAFSDSFAISDFSAIALHKGLVDTVGFSDGLQNAVSLGKADTVSVNDLHSVAIEKADTDVFSFSDELQTATAFARGFADAATMLDEPTLSVSKPATDVLTLSEAQQKTLSLGKANSFSFGDAQSSVFEKQVIEAFGVTDSFGRVATYFRNLTDTFGLDELVNVTPNYGFEKTNVFSFTENFSYEVRAGHNSVLNSSALNTYTLNT